jgi:hypothetical protein
MRLWPQRLLLVAVFAVGQVYAQDPPAPEKPEPYADFLKRTSNLPGDQQGGESEAYWAKVKAYNEWTEAQDAKNDAATALSWAQSLKPLEGGWELVDVSNDGRHATFESRRQLMRDGSTVYVWLRFENRVPQPWQYTGMPQYKSAAERDHYDCSRQLSKIVSMTAYAESNFDKPNQNESVVYDEKVQQWTPIIPGTLGEKLAQWACRAQTSHANAVKPN